MKLSLLEVYKLGLAAGSFSVGQIDQGVHCVLPVTDEKTGKEENTVFEPLCEMFLSLKPGSDGLAYIGACQKFGRSMGIKNMPEHCIDEYESSTK